MTKELNELKKMLDKYQLMAHEHDSLIRELILLINTSIDTQISIPNDMLMLVIEISLKRTKEILNK